MLYLRATHFKKNMITYPKAVDEKGTLHHIEGITQENRHDHTYYCLGCGEEMVPVICGTSKESHFRHKKENPDCNNESYLHNYAKKRLEERFNTESTFKVSYYVTNDCPKKDSCPLYKRYQWNECSGMVLHSVDLKKLYDTCQTEGTYDGFRADVLLTSSKNPDTKPLFLEVLVNHPCSSEKLASGNLIIEIKVDEEADAEKKIIESDGPLIITGGLRDSSVLRHGIANESPSLSILFHNFSRSSHRDDIKKLDSFVLFEDNSVRRFESIVPCGYAGKKCFKGSLFEVHYYDTGFRVKRPKYDLFNLGLCLAMMRGKNLRHCGYCERFQGCWIIVPQECIDPRTGQKVSSRKAVLNRLLSDNEINRRQAAMSCPKWRLNAKLCNAVMAEYYGKPFFVWDSADTL